MNTNFSEHLRYIENEINNCRSQMDKLPPGKLVCTKNGKYTKWYVSANGLLTYIPKKDKDYAESLAQKRYLQEKLRHLESERRACTLYQKHHKDIEKETLQFLDESGILANLLSTKYLPQKESHLLWQQESFNANPQHPENLIHRSISGHYLRSKSEVFIDMALFNAGIPFRYECELAFPGVTLYPDFTIIHPITDQLKYWEHFGLIDNPIYFKSFMSKLQIYTSNGIYPGENLIMTFETSNCPLTYAYVEEIVRNML